MSKESAIQALIKTALNEVGYLEKASNNNLDDKTTNAGSANFTKYARDLDAIKGFYNFPKNGYAWCDIFHDWCMVQTYGLEKAKQMMYHNQYGAGCEESARAYKDNGAFFNYPEVGDQIFFGYNGIGHTGIVIGKDNKYVYTVEGNTSGASGIIANGGGVCKKKYALNYSGIKGYGRPNYQLVEDDFMTQAEFNKMADAWSATKGTLAPSEYAENTAKKAVDCGIFADGDNDGYLDQPQAFIKRQEVAVLLDRLGLLNGKVITYLRAIADGKK